MPANQIDWKKMDAILSVNEADEYYLFHDQIEQIKERCRDIIGSVNTIENASEERAEARPPVGMRRESIIGIVGERGSGKSSLLRTACKALKSERYYVLDVLDPNVFDDSMSILELFISQIYRKLQEFETDHSDIDEYTSIDLYSRLKQISKILSDFQSGKENFYQTHTYADLLDNIMLRVNMPALIRELVQRFLSLIRRERQDGAEYVGLVLCIDDVDLVSNVKIYSLLEDIRKYLAGNIIVITAFRSSQLFDAVLSEKLKENERLINANTMGIGDVRDQAARYLEKLIPVHGRIRLLDADDLLRRPYYQIFYALMEVQPSGETALKEQLDAILSEKGLGRHGSVLSMREWLYFSLNLRIRLKLDPVDRWENTIYNLPVNLRGLLQLIYLIVERMQTVSLKQDDSSVSEKERKTLCSHILKNLEEYRGYFLQGIQEVLPVELRGVIDLWQRSDYRAKNYLICDELLKKIAAIDKLVLAELPQFNLYQIYNICLGDVYQVIEIYKSVCGSEDKSRYFVYCLKVLYSIELLTHYLRAAENIVADSRSEDGDALDPELEIYLTLINAKIVNNSFAYFSRTPWEGGIVYTESEEEETRELYRKLLYSAVAVESDLRRSLPKYSSSNDTVRRDTRTASQITTYGTLKYRSLYEYNTEMLFSELKRNTSYPTDPFAFLGQSRYVESTYDEKRYVFFSMFDIDAIVRFNYGRGVEPGKKREALEYLLRYVDYIVSGEDVSKGAIKPSKYESELIQGMADVLWYSEEIRKGRERVFADAEGNIKGFQGLPFKTGSIEKLSKSAVLLMIQQLLSDHANTLSPDDRALLTTLSETIGSRPGKPTTAEKDTLTNIVEKTGVVFDFEELGQKANMNARKSRSKKARAKNPV